MPTIQRDQVQEPVLRREEVDSPPIGGTVIVRGLLMARRYALLDLHASLPPAEQNYRVILSTLAESVILDDGQPVYSVDQWDRFASSNHAEAIRLFEITSRLNGGNLEEVAKN